MEGVEPSRVYQQRKLVHFYVQSVQEVVEGSSSLTLSEYKLLGKIWTIKMLKS